MASHSSVTISVIIGSGPPSICSNLVCTIESSSVLRVCTPKIISGIESSLTSPRAWLVKTTFSLAPYSIVKSGSSPLSSKIK